MEVVTNALLAGTMPAWLMTFPETTALGFKIVRHNAGRGTRASLVSAAVLFLAKCVKRNTKQIQHRDAYLRDQYCSNTTDCFVP